MGLKENTNISYFYMATYFSIFFAVYLQIDSIIEESELFKYYTELSFFKLFVIAHGIRLDIMYFSLTKLLFKKLSVFLGAYCTWCKALSNRVECKVSLLFYDQYFNNI